MPVITPQNMNQDVILTSGTSAAQRPALAGQIVYDTIVPGMSFAGVGGPASNGATGQLQVRVVRSNSTGLLDFYYRAILPAGSGTVANMMFGVGWTMPRGCKITYADYRPDGAGIAAPLKIDFTQIQGTFQFQWPGTIGDVSTRFVFVSTNATQFARNGMFVSAGTGLIDPANFPAPSMIQG